MKYINGYNIVVSLVIVSVSVAARAFEHTPKVLIHDGMVIIDAPPQLDQRAYKKIERQLRHLSKKQEALAKKYEEMQGKIKEFETSDRPRDARKAKAGVQTLKKLKKQRDQLAVKKSALEQKMEPVTVKRPLAPLTGKCAVLEKKLEALTREKKANERRIAQIEARLAPMKRWGRGTANVDKAIIAYELKINTLSKRNSVLEKELSKLENKILISEENEGAVSVQRTIRSPRARSAYIRKNSGGLSRVARLKELLVSAQEQAFPLQENKVRHINDLIARYTLDDPTADSKRIVSELELLVAKLRTEEKRASAQEIELTYQLASRLQKNKQEIVSLHNPLMSEMAIALATYAAASAHRQAAEELIGTLSAGDLVGNCT